MRELNTVEQASVTGAGNIADAAALLGKGIGSIIDAAHKGNTAATAAGEVLGRGIGMVVEVSVTLFQGLLGGISDLFSKK
ncbi:MULTISPECIES: hypothetical protein [Leclercia]|uniref:hypothetical protein n=1 Tax=Leclercia TaxID=83654 RepID=UPI003219A099